MIEIINLRVEKLSKPYDVKVDRSSPLGNPFPMRNASKVIDLNMERNRVCDAYKIMFNQAHESGANIDMVHETTRLVQIYKQHGKLRLFCWCAPQRCHAETIKTYIEESHI